MIGEGILALKNPDQITIMDFNSGESNIILDKTVFSFSATSPDGKWLAYGYYPETGNPRIVVVSADIQKKIEIPMGMGWLDNLGTWLDNEHLSFPVWFKQGMIAAMVLVDPFTGKQQEIPSDYPGLERYQLGFSAGAGLHFDYSSVVYDPSLKYVVYPETYVDGYYLTLWNRETKTVITRLLDGSGYGHLPVWLPDGSQVLVVARPQANKPKEWFYISLSGQSQQLTHFGDKLSEFYIQNNASVSPDGHYLAFGLSTQMNGNWWDAGQLVILDLRTQNVMETCIPLSTRDKPVWSPDSHYLAFTEPGSIHPAPVVLLDLEQHLAVQIDIDKEPIGWMAGQ